MVSKERRAVKKVRVRVSSIRDRAVTNNSIRKEIPVPMSIHVGEETFVPSAILAWKEIPAPPIREPCNWRASLGLVLEKFMIQEADFDRLKIKYVEIGINSL